jgi:hypothetical protein
MMKFKENAEWEKTTYLCSFLKNKQKFNKKMGKKKQNETK